jgi:protein TonB
VVAPTDPNAAPNAVAVADSTTNSAENMSASATIPGSPAGSASPAPAPSAALPATNAPKTGPGQPKQESAVGHTGTSSAAAPASTTAAPAKEKSSSSDLIEVPEDFADDQVVHRVHPAYPKQARAKKLHGTVVLQAVVNKQGKVDSLQLVSGDPQLAQAAAEAVKQWRYKPYSRNGEPTDFQTKVTVDFKLQ